MNELLVATISLGLYSMSTVRYVSGRTSTCAPGRGAERISNLGVGFKLLNMFLEVNWPYVITRDYNKPLCEGNVVPAGRISDTFNELTDCHFELGLTLEA